MSKNKNKISNAFSRYLETALTQGMEKAEKLLPDLENGDLSSVENRVFLNMKKFIDFSRETYDFNKALSEGDLSVEAGRENFLAMSSKALQSSLKNLIWQTQRIKEGDLNQKINFLGEFSDSYNSLIENLKKNRELDKKLEASEKKFRLLMEQSPIDIEIYNTDGTMHEVNKAWENLWQSKRKDAIGKFNILNDPQIKEFGILPYVKRAFAGEPQDIPEFEYDPKKAGFQGRSRWIKSHIYPIKDSHDRVLNVILTHEDITEQKATVKNLHLFKKAVDSSLNGVGIADLNGKTIYKNKALDEMLVDFGNNPLSAYVDKNKGNEVFTRLISGNNWSGELEMHGRTGEILTVYLSAYPIFDDNKKTISFVGIHTDITTHKKEEREKTNKQLFLDSIIEQSPFPTWISDLEGTMIRTNLALEEVLNLSRDKLVGKYNVYKDPQVVDQDLVNVINDTINKGKTSDFELVWSGEESNDRNLKGSNKIHCEGTIFPIKDMKGKITNAVIAYKDVSSRIVAEQALKDSEKRFKDISLYIADWIWEVNKDGVFTFCSENVENILEYPKNEIQGRSMFDLMPEDEAKKIKKQFMEISKQKNPFVDLRNTCIHKNGEKVHLLTSGYPLFDEHGNLIGFRGANKDITSRVNAEEKIHALAKFPSENPNPVLRVTDNGVLIYSNVVGLKLLGKYWGIEKGKLMPKDFIKALKSKKKRIKYSFGSRTFLFTITPIKDAGYINVYAEEITKRLMSQQELINTNIELESAHKHAMYMLALASEYKDSDTGEHIKRIVKMTTELALELGIKPNRATKMGSDSILHDLGKLGISDNILLKPGKLSENEFEKIKQHTIIGAKIIGEDEWFNHASQIAMSHHEKWDGSGYPNSLKGEDIPISARIVAIADVFDALISKRPYKEPWPLDKAVKEVKRESGKHFDPRIVAAFLSLQKKGKLEKYVTTFHL